MRTRITIAIATGVAVLALPVAPAYATDCNATAFVPAPNIMAVEFGGIVKCSKGHPGKTHQIQIRIKQDRAWPLRDRTLYSSPWEYRRAGGTHVIVRKMLCSTLRDRAGKSQDVPVYSQIVTVEVGGRSSDSDNSGNYEAC